MRLQVELQQPEKNFYVEHGHRQPQRAREFRGVCLIAIQAYYQRVELAPRYVVFDEIAGGVLATLVAMLVVGVLVLATDQFYKGTGRTPQEFDVGWLRSLHDALDGAALVHFLRGNMIPGLVTVITPFVPQAVRTVYS